MDEMKKKLVVKKGAWSHEEDLLLRKCIEEYGEGKWHQVPVRAGLNRCRKSCRLRWFNYLHPNIKRGEYAEDEIDLILRMHKLLGNKWSLIAGRLPGRTANDVKNYWNSHLYKRPEFQLPRLRQNDVIRPQVLSFKGKGISHGLLLANQLPLPELLQQQHEDTANWWSDLLDNVNLAEAFCGDMNDGPSTSSFTMDIKKMEEEKSLLPDNCSMHWDDFLDTDFRMTDK